MLFLQSLAKDRALFKGNARSEKVISVLGAMILRVGGMRLAARLTYEEIHCVAILYLIHVFIT